MQVHSFPNFYFFRNRDCYLLGVSTRRRTFFFPPFPFYPVFLTDIEFQLAMLGLSRTIRRRESLFPPSRFFSALPLFPYLSDKLRLPVGNARAIMNDSTTRVTFFPLTFFFVEKQGAVDRAQQAIFK